MAYFPAISLSFKESVAFNFGSRPLRYPLGRRLWSCLESLGEAERGSLPQGLCGLGWALLPLGVRRVQLWGGCGTTVL